MGRLIVKEYPKDFKKATALENINRIIKEHITNRISGKIIINFFEGGITSWKTERTFKPEK